MNLQHVEQVKKKGAIIIRLCSEKDKGRLTTFLNSEPVFHTFLLADIEQYGFDKDYQKVYVQEKEGVCEAVFLKYYSNFILAGDPAKIDYEKVSSVIGPEITTIMGNAEIVEKVIEKLKTKFNLICNNLYVHEPESKIVQNELKVANLDNVDRIHEFLMCFPEFRVMYAEKGMIINRIRNNEGVHLFIEKDGEIIAHGNSAASAEKTCMMGGICVKEEYRHLGYAKTILRALCRYIESIDKIPCIFAKENPEYSIFKELNFKRYGRWGVANVVKGEN